MKARSTITATFLLVTYLLSSPVCLELWKIPKLVNHFSYHRSQETSEKLLSFLIEHYLLEDGTDADSHEDRQLPFKGEHQLIPGAITYTVPLLFQFSVNLPAEEPVISGWFNDRFLPEVALPAIWQPPRC